MSGHNLLRFYYSEYQKALQSYKDQDEEAAEETCCYLVTSFECPRLIQVQAHQLRSLCTSNYSTAKGHLQSAFDLIESLNAGHDELVARTKSHTEVMMEELEQKWREAWAARGQLPPEERAEKEEDEAEADE